DKFAEAEPYYQRALSITERQVGLEHPLVATRLNYLSGLYFAWGRFEDAERLVKNSAYIYEKFLGPNHAVLAVAY
ncbi:tetratricopeptide repeat protein, partial [Escherichia coli]|uniref:tetratricopeptide repeat protein n=1 Tax=Escherichia coli TaxID=562 RepID=UPI003CE453DA